MFWDSSAVVPYLVFEEWTHEAITLLSKDPTPAIWWMTPVECASAIERRRREGALEPDRYEEARRRLINLDRHMDIIEAHSTIRDRALRILAVHSLRSADALQLAAALIYCNEQPREELFVCLDERLRQAAQTEGFTLVPES